MTKSIPENISNKVVPAVNVSLFDKYMHNFPIGYTFTC